MVLLPAGTYILSLAGVDEDEAVTGDIDITDAVIISGAGPEATIVDAAAIDRVMDLLPGDSPRAVALTDLTLRNGKLPAPGGGIHPGGAGLRVGEHVYLDLARVNVRDNRTEGWRDGVGIYDVHLNDHTFISNTILSGNGPGFLSDDCVGVESLDGATIEDGTALGTIFDDDTWCPTCRSATPGCSRGTGKRAPSRSPSSPGVVPGLRDQTPDSAKVRVTIALDRDIVEHFKEAAAARGALPYQTQINQTLRRAMDEPPPKP